MGGLLVRAALPLLEEEFGRFFYSFISLSCPHLGYIHAPNIMFKAGFWLVRKLRRSVCLEQLAMKDAEDRKETLLYKLASASGLSRFKNVVLLSSAQDCYAPFESVRLEKVLDNQAEPKMAEVYEEMVGTILSDLVPEHIIRIDVNMHLPESSLDTFVGRAAHIQFIENQIFMRML